METQIGEIGDADRVFKLVIILTISLFVLHRLGLL